MNTDTLLILVVGLLTFNLLFVGVYIVLVLKEVRETVRRINSILIQVDRVSESVATPIVGLSGAVAGVLEGLNIFKKAQSLTSLFSRKGVEKNE